MFPKQPGTYCFKNTVNNKVYIGSAQCLYTRINNHLKAKNSNQHLQNAIKHYGINSFCVTYQVLETKKQALCLEQMLLDYIFKLNINCYNIANKVSGGCIGTKENHKAISAKGKSYKAKVRFALKVNSPSCIYTFTSGVEAARKTNVLVESIAKSCKIAKPCNSELERWLFSDVSINDLKAKFNNLTQAEIKGFNKNTVNNTKAFVLINVYNLEVSEPFYKIQEAIKQGYKITHSNFINCLLGKRRSVNGYYVNNII